LQQLDNGVFYFYIYKKNRRFKMIWILFFLIADQNASVQVGFINQEVLSLDIRAKRIDIGLLDVDSSPIEFPGIIQGTIHANTEWVLLCSVKDDFLSPEGNRIPIERFAWRIEGMEWVPFGTEEDKILEGNATEETGRPLSIDLKFDLKWEDSAGDFLTNIDFTLIKK
jgi:hypothetical protein